ncbi:MAG: DUF58 domain-containing protein [Planctomycetaceae bacterium]
MTLIQVVSRLLIYDFCPEVNRWFYWVKRPTAILGMAAVAALVCAVFVKPLAMVAFCAVAIVVLLGYCWPSISIRGLSCTMRFCQSRVTEDDTVRTVVRIKNRWPWPVWGMVIDGGFLPNNSPPVTSSESVALACVAGWSTSEFEWEFIPRCRGEYPLSTPRLATGFPFGLRKASLPVKVEQTVLVWPRLIPLETLLDAAETRPSDDMFSEQRVGDSGDMTGTRLFRDGDSLRRVHWAQTARQGRMIVCERQAAAQSAIRVVFDSDPHLHRGEGRDSTLEWSIRIAASICAAYHRENAQVECCFGHETIPLQAGTSGMKSFLDTLSRWKSCQRRHGSNCEHEHKPHQCHRIHHRNCGVFQLTITTDLGLQHQTEHRHVHGDQRMVVLKADAFARPCDICGEEHLPPNRSSIVLDRPDSVSIDFRRKWRHVCHAG